jgi:hypothetical protein
MGWFLDINHFKDLTFLDSYTFCTICLMASMSFPCHIFVGWCSLHKYSPLALKMNVCKYIYLYRIWTLFTNTKLKSICSSECAFCIEQKLD